MLSALDNQELTLIWTGIYHWSQAWYRTLSMNNIVFREAMQKSAATLPQRAWLLKIPCVILPLTNIDIPLVFIKWKYTLSKWPTTVVFTKWINNTFEFTTRIPLVYRNETGYLPHSQLHVESGRLVSVISSLSIRLGTKFTLAMYTTLH